ncbi:hypothetical protein Ddye_017630 [Dipteronia dyeriana]|uniref:DUF659 domain-containing protein n=1 Tax=Dipteronia dyeriana TaxID=168575 RepID=A0AAD9U8Z6_9ROSI|nr:hypothetical protein Ddye_017630 [Dipteronia dyeriana]
MRSIMNLRVNCKEGIKQIGPDNVVQVVSDNVANNMAATRLLKEKMPHIFWTLCASHTINLMLESIGKLPKLQKYLDLDKSFTIFVYAYPKTLSLLRIFTRKRDIVRPRVTRFVSAFLTLQSLVDKKDKLRTMFTINDWETCRWSKSLKGKTTYSTVKSLSFWKGVNLCLRVFAPLVKVFRLVDGD